MKKICLVGFAMIMILFIFFISVPSFDMTRIPDGYIKKEEYYDQDGFQDYTDYAKYFYTSIDYITKDKEYKKIEQIDIVNIVEYVNDFRGWMKSGDRLSEFDLDVNVITEGDYFKIQTKEGQKIGNGVYGKFDNYSLYFFDVETLTLYYLHNNV